MQFVKRDPFQPVEHIVGRPHGDRDVAADPAEGEAANLVDEMCVRGIPQHEKHRGVGIVTVGPAVASRSSPSDRARSMRPQASAFSNLSSAS